MDPRIPDAAVIAAGRAALAAGDPALALADVLTPPFGWRVTPRGYAGLLRHVVGQQVSTVSADAMWSRLQAAVGPVTPTAVAALDDTALRALGFSRQKAAYARAMAAAAEEGQIDFAALPALPHDEALATLVALHGVGRWTAETYLLMGEGALDAWPGGDIALQEAIRWVDGLDSRPGQEEAYARAERWRPLRGVAAHLLWALYVGVRTGEIAAPAAWTGVRRPVTPS